LFPIGTLVRPDQRLKKVPNSATEFIGVPLPSNPQQTYYRFSAAGTYLDSYALPFQSVRSLDSRLFEFFPAGDRYVSGAGGDVFAKNTTYVASLPRPGRAEFSCYALDEAAQTIHAGTTARAVQVFSMDTYTLLRTLKTKLYPLRLFKDGAHGFVSLGTAIRGEYYTGNNQGNPREKTPMVIEYLP